jgi:spermidine synthase
MFETLWFRLAGLTFGNSVWASALVLASFMAGMALGNWLAAARGSRIRYPVRFYAFLEVVVGSSGLALVLLFPVLTHWLKPLFRAVLDMPLVLNFLRLSISFLLMTIPTTCMGMTLPLLVKALYSETPNFGQVLGKLYGWNTMGAVAGTLLTEAAFIGWLGVTGTGIAAGLFNLLAAAAALIIARSVLGRGRESMDGSGSRSALSKPSATGIRMLLAGFFSGAILLALEVVWFRFLTLFLSARSLAFAVMLSVVLAGIGLGGVFASLWFRVEARPQQHTATVALLSGTVSITSYVVFGWLITPLTVYYSEWTHMFYVSLILMFPTSLLSGILFTLIGQGVHRDIGDSLGTTGLFTMVNTTGAALGALLAGFVLLPEVGMEKSFFWLSFGYVLVAIFSSDKAEEAPSGSRRYLTLGAAAVFLIAVAAFPFESMETRILSVGTKALGRFPGWFPVAIREGLTETSQYWQKFFFNKPLYTWLFTNNHSMSSNLVYARRYMKLFVYWPVAIHPDLKNALLICYGVGSTAQALTDVRDIQSIDVVDISRDIVDSSAIVFPDQKDNPLNDPRVRLHIEDGRFFLQTTKNHYDLITGEPPPPLLAGVVNLYSQEHFQLMYDCLKEGGIVTYWFPVYQLTDSGAKSILRAFCNVFEDCSLWTGHGFEWMLVGTRNARGPVSEKDFIRQWSNPSTARELTRLGFEKPEQIGTTFLMDSAALKEFVRDSLPVTDNYPKRIFGFPGDAKTTLLEQYRSLLNIDHTKELFRKSPLVSALWPQSVQARTLDYFPLQGLLNDAIIRTGRETREVIADTLHPILTRSLLESPIYWAMESRGPVYPEDFDGVSDDETLREVPNFNYTLGVSAMAGRRFLEAEKYFAAEQRITPAPHLTDLRVYLLCMAGRHEDALRLVESDIERYNKGSGQSYLAWLSKTFDLGRASARQQ